MLMIYCKTCKPCEEFAKEITWYNGSRAVMCSICGRRWKKGEKHGTHVKSHQEEACHCCK